MANNILNFTILFEVLRISDIKETFPGGLFTRKSATNTFNSHYRNVRNISYILISLNVIDEIFISTPNPLITRYSESTVPI